VYCFSQWRARAGVATLARTKKGGLKFIYFYKTSIKKFSFYIGAVETE
jgi:hypothetical protein